MSLHGRRWQSGLTLVELMVAMAISLMLIAGAIKLFVASKELFMLQQHSAHAQEGGRVGMFVMSHVIRQAGFYRNGLLAAEDARLLFPAAAPALVGEEGDKAPDAITIRYQGHEDGTVLDCLGNPVTCMGNTVCAAHPQAGAILAINRFFLTPVSPESGLRSLSCTRSIPSANPPKEDTQPLIEGVSDLQFVYGVDVDGDRAADRYLKADQVAVMSDWSRVMSVRVTFTSQGGAAAGRPLSARVPITQRYDETVWLRNR